MLEVPFSLLPRLEFVSDFGFLFIVGFGCGSAAPRLLRLFAATFVIVSRNSKIKNPVGFVTLRIAGLPPGDAGVLPFHCSLTLTGKRGMKRR
jgi:hypothetical protein